LLDAILRMGFDVLIYSDLDVVWLQPVDSIVLDTFAARPEVDLLIQSLTRNPSSPELCMGLAAFRNSPRTLELIATASELHEGMSLNKSRVGDDDVITELFKRLGYPHYILELPNAIFPTGNMLNLYRRREAFPGVKAPSPAIYHSNFVIGLENKELLIRIFLTRSQKRTLGLGIDTRLYIRWKLKILKHIFRKISHARMPA